MKTGRRAFLKSIGFAAGAFATGTPLTRALVFEDALDPENRVDLDAALEHAKASARPLLVLVVAAETSGREETFGIWLQDDAAIRSGRFAEVDIVCAGPDALRARVSGIEASPSEPWYVLLEWIDGAWCATACDETLPPRLPYLDFVSVDENGEADPRYAATPEASAARDAERSRLLTRALASALDEDAAARSERVFAALREHERSLLLRSPAQIEDEEPEPARALDSELVRRAASWLSARESGAEALAALRTRLGRDEAKRLLAAPPPGSEWYQPSFCGRRYPRKPERDFSIACGSALVWEEGRTFLELYVDPPR